MAPLMFSQRDGTVIIELEDTTEIVVDKEDVPTLLQVVMTALRVGGYSEDQLRAAAMTCRANLIKYL